MKKTSIKLRNTGEVLTFEVYRSFVYCIERIEIWDIELYLNVVERNYPITPSPIPCPLPLDQGKGCK